MRSERKKTMAAELQRQLVELGESMPDFPPWSTILDIANTIREVPVLQRTECERSILAKIEKEVVILG